MILPGGNAMLEVRLFAFDGLIVPDSQISGADLFQFLRWPYIDSEMMTLSAEAPQETRPDFAKAGCGAAYLLVQSLRDGFHLEVMTDERNRQAGVASPVLWGNAVLKIQPGWRYSLLAYSPPQNPETP